MSDERNGGRRPDAVISALPGLARIAAGVWWRTAGWTVGTTARAGERVVRAAMSGESPTNVIGDFGHEVRGYAREVLGLTELEQRVSGASSVAGVPGRAQDLDDDTGTLRQRGEALLARSADVTYDEEAHPAYDRILGELAPDEGRILRFLALEGAQPAVDVRSSKTFNVTSELVAPGISMIGAGAGTRFTDRVPAYLNNLYRLGLIWFSREPLEDPLRYQVLEAQPEVLTALHSGGRGKTVRRSILLTPFGEDFCRTCLPIGTAELDALPADVVVSRDERTHRA